MSVLEVFSQDNKGESGPEARPRGNSQISPLLSESTKNRSASLSTPLQTKNENYGSIVVDASNVDVIPNSRSHDTITSTSRKGFWGSLDVHRWFYSGISEANEISRAKARTMKDAIRNANAVNEFDQKKERIDRVATERGSSTKSATTRTSSAPLTTDSTPLQSVFTKYVQPRSSTVSKGEFKYGVTRNALSERPSDSSGEVSPTRVSLLKMEDNKHGEVAMCVVSSGSDSLSLKGDGTDNAAVGSERSCDQHDYKAGEDLLK